MPFQKPPSGKVRMYRSTPPRTIVMSLIRKVGSALTISSSRAVARSHRMPPVQYMSTFLPESASLVFSSASHFGNSRLLRIFGSSSVAPPSGGAKWPIADSYAFRTSITTASGWGAWGERLREKRARGRGKRC